MTTQITSTATRLTTPFLYLREPFALSVLASEAGAGLTLTVKLCETGDGDPRLSSLTTAAAALGCELRLVRLRSKTG